MMAGGALLVISGGHWDTRRARGSHIIEEVIFLGVDFIIPLVLLSPSMDPVGLNNPTL